MAPYLSLPKQLVLGLQIVMLACHIRHLFSSLTARELPVQGGIYVHEQYVSNAYRASLHRFHPRFQGNSLVLSPCVAAHFPA